MITTAPITATLTPMSTAVGTPPISQLPVRNPSSRVRTEPYQMK